MVSMEQRESDTAAFSRRKKVRVTTTGEVSKVLDGENLKSEEEAKKRMRRIKSLTRS
jgi:hypothetical protein